MTFLPGHKTYAVAGLAAVGSFLTAMDWVSAEQWQHIYNALIALALIFQRMATKKLGA